MIDIQSFLKEDQDENPNHSKLNDLILNFSNIIKKITKLINKSYLNSAKIKHINKYNIHGDNQTILDIEANELIINDLQRDDICVIISEELEEPHYINEKQGLYVVYIDPIDGSNSINTNNPIGTIISVYHRISPLGEKLTEQDLLQPGSNQILSAYSLYSTVTNLVYTIGNGINIFTHDIELDRFIVTKKNFISPNEHKIYSVNESYYEYFSEVLKFRISLLKKQKLTARYTGSLVADFHRILIQGGIFIYPSNQLFPTGKLRLMMECNPIAYIVKQTNGIATTSYNNEKILDIIPKSIDQTTPLYIQT